MKFFFFLFLFTSLLFANEPAATQSVYAPAPSTVNVEEPTTQEQSAKKSVYSFEHTKPKKSAFRTWIAPSILAAITAFCGAEAMFADNKAADLAKTKVSSNFEYYSVREDIKDYQDSRNGLLALTGIFGAAFIASMAFSIAF